MRRSSVGVTLIVILILTIIVWLISSFQGLLPSGLNNVGFLFFLALVGVIGILDGFNGAIELIERFINRKNQHVSDVEGEQKDEHDNIDGYISVPPPSPLLPVDINTMSQKNLYDQLNDWMSEPYLVDSEFRSVVSGFLNAHLEKTGTRLQLPQARNSISSDNFLEYLRARDMLDNFCEYLLGQSSFIDRFPR